MIVIVQYVRQLYCYRNPAIYSDPVWAVRSNDQLFGKERTCANLRLLSQKLETQYPYIQTKKRTWLNPLSSSRYLFIVFYRVPIFPFGCYKLLGKFKIPCAGYKNMSYVFLYMKTFNINDVQRRSAQKLKPVHRQRKILNWSVIKFTSSFCSTLNIIQVTLLYLQIQHQHKSKAN